jgi:hypothetical protein
VVGEPDSVGGARFGGLRSYGSVARGYGGYYGGRRYFYRVRCRGREGQSLRPNLIRDGGPIKTSFRKMWYWLGHVEK